MDFYSCLLGMAYWWFWYFELFVGFCFDFIIVWLGVLLTCVCLVEDLFGLALLFSLLLCSLVLGGFVLVCV